MNTFVSASRRRCAQIPCLARHRVLCSRSEEHVQRAARIHGRGPSHRGYKCRRAEKLIRDEHEGLLIPPNNVTAMADAIERLLKDAGHARSLGDRASTGERVVQPLVDNAEDSKTEYLELLADP